MPISINASPLSQNSILSAQRAQRNEMQRIATGTRNPSAGFDPAAYVIDAMMNYDIGGIDASNENTQRSSAMLRVAEGGVSSSVDALANLQQTLLNAANGTNNDSDLRTLQKTVNETLQTLGDNANVQFNGINLLNGSQNVTVATQDGQQSVVQLGDMRPQALGLTNAQGQSTIDVSSPTSLTNALGTVGNALNNAQGQQGILGRALDRVLDQATSIGAAQQALNYQSNNLTTEAENLTAASNTINGTDIANAVTRLSQDSTQQQAMLFAQQAQMSTMASRYASLGLLMH